jgi:hypothetical protein
MTNPYRPELPARLARCPLCGKPHGEFAARCDSCGTEIDEVLDVESLREEYASVRRRALWALALLLAMVAFNMLFFPSGGILVLAPVGWLFDCVRRGVPLRRYLRRLSNRPTPPQSDVSL